MKPQFLRLLRINDDPRDVSAISRAPITALKPVSRWLDFCKSLSSHRLPEFELLTIDFNFDKDQTTPKFTYQSAPVDPSPPHDEDLLQRLQWSDRLGQTGGKNTGLVIGASAISSVMYRDVPVGAATHTGFQDIPARDVTSALLLGQILAACGEAVPVENGRDLLRSVISFVLKGPATCEAALPIAVGRFREGFLRRACRSTDTLVQASVWVKLDSLLAVEGTLKAKTNNELARGIAEHGLEFHDRNGRFYSYNLNSLFLDVLAEYDQNKQVVDFRPSLTLEDVDAKSVSGEKILHFLGELSTNAITNIQPILEFLACPNGETVNERFPSKAQRLIAMLLACCDQFADKYFEFGDAWNALKWEPDERHELPPLNSQLQALLNVLHSEGALPLESQNGPSVLKLIHAWLQNTDDEVLTLALRDDPTAPPDPSLSAHRRAALSKMLQILVERGVVEQLDGRYRANSRRLPAQMTLSLDKDDLNRRLGFNKENAWRHLQDIVDAAFDSPSTSAFFEALETEALPAHLRGICTAYLQSQYELIPVSAWPLFLQKPARPGYWIVGA